MPKQPIIETAKQIEEHLQKVLDLAEDTDLIAATFLATIRVAQKNVAKRAYDITDKERSQKFAK